MGGLYSKCKPCRCDEETPIEYMERLERKQKGIIMKGNRMDIMGTSMYNTFGGLKRKLGLLDSDSENEINNSHISE